MNPEARLDLDSLLVHTSFVRRLARSLVHDDAYAEDLAQDTMVSAIGFAERSTDRVESPRGLLAAIARRLASKRVRGELRRVRREAGATFVRAESTPEQIVEREALRRRVIEAVLALDEPIRRTVIARYLDEMPAVAIAARDGVPVETVRTRLKRATEKLRAKLDAECGDGGWRAGLAPLASVGFESGVDLLGGSALAIGAKLAGVAALVAGAVWLGSIDPEVATPPIESPLVAAAPPARSEEADAAASLASLAVASAPVREPVEDTPAIASDSGRVVDEAGRPIAGASVTVVTEIGVDRGVTLYRRRHGTTTGAAGEFTIARAPIEKEGDEVLRQRLEVLAPGFAVKRPSARVTNDPGSGYPDIVLDLGGTVRGVVLDQESRPVPDVLIAVGRDTSGFLAYWRAGIGGSMSDFVTGRTDGKGRFELMGVPRGWAHAYAFGDQGIVFRSEQFTVDAGTRTDPVLVRFRRFEPHEAIVVTAFDHEGKAWPGARITQYSHKVFENDQWIGRNSDVTTDPFGRYSFFSDEGEVHSFALWSDDAAVASADGVTVPGSKVELRAAMVRPVRLLVKDATGAHRRDAHVAVFLHDENMAVDRDKTRVVPGDDAFRFAAPFGKFSVRVECAGYADASLPSLDGATVPDELTIHLKALSGIRGVVRANGAPVAGAAVDLMGRADDRLDGLSVVWSRRSGRDGETMADTSEDGSFWLAPTQEGRYCLRVKSTDFAPAWVGPFDFDPNAAQVSFDVSLGLGGVLSGRVTREDGASAVGMTVKICFGDELIRSTRVDVDGGYRFERLAPGDYEVAIWAYEGGSSSTRSISSFERDPPKRDTQARVDEGSEARCDLFVPRAVTEGTRIRGRIRVGAGPLVDFGARLIERDEAASGDLFSHGLARREMIKRTSNRRAGTVPPDGEFALETHDTGNAWVVIGPRVQFGSSIRYAIPVSLTGGTIDVAFDTDAGDLIVTPPNDGREPPGQMSLVWRGPNDIHARLSVGRSDDGTYRFTRVPAGEVSLKAFGDPFTATVRANETVTVEAK